MASLEIARAQELLDAAISEGEPNGPHSSSNKAIDQQCKTLCERHSHLGADLEGAREMASDCS